MQPKKGHATWLQQVEEERASHAIVDPLVTGVKQFVRLQFGNTEAVQATLADFGLDPTKKAVVPPATKVAAAAKAKATRASKATKAAPAAAASESPTPAAPPATK